MGFGLVVYIITGRSAITSTLHEMVATVTGAGGGAGPLPEPFGSTLKQHHRPGL
jgi:hypothetical protein